MKITKREDGRYQASVIVGYDIDGKAKRKYVYAQKRKDLLTKVDVIRGQIKAGTYLEPSKLTLESWLKTWLASYMKHSLRPTTFESYQELAKNHIIPELGIKRLVDIKTADLQAFYSKKLASGGRLDNKPGGLSVSTVKYLHGILHHCFEQARKEGMLIVNPASNTRLPKNEQVDIAFLDKDGVKALLKAAKDSRHYAAFLIAVGLGLRRGEILGLRWSDVDLETGILTVNQAVVRTKEQGIIFAEPKTKLSQRSLSIPLNILAALKAHKVQQAKEKLAAGEAYKKEEDLVFTSEFGIVVDPRNFVRRFNHIMKKAGLPHIKFHGLRHTYAVLSLQEGIDVKSIQENLGHHKAAFTLDVYGGVTAKMRKEATRKIDALLASCLSE